MQKLVIGKLYEKQDWSCTYCKKEFPSVKGMMMHFGGHGIGNYAQSIERQRSIASVKNRGTGNGMYREDAKLSAIHLYVKARKLRPRACENCGEVKRLDLANISQQYKRDLDDWQWLCRRCHMASDGRLNKLIEGNRAGIHPKNGKSRVDKDKLRRLRCR